MDALQEFHKFATEFINEKKTPITSNAEDLLDFFLSTHPFWEELCFSTYNMDFDSKSALDKTNDDGKAKFTISSKTKENERKQSVIFYFDRAQFIQEDNDPYKTALAFITAGDQYGKEVLISNKEKDELIIDGYHIVLLYHHLSRYADPEQKKLSMFEYFGLCLNEENVVKETKDEHYLDLPTKFDILPKDFEESYTNEEDKEKSVNEILEGLENLLQDADIQPQLLELNDQLSKILKKHYELIETDEEEYHITLIIKKDEEQKYRDQAFAKICEFLPNAAKSFTESKDSYIWDFWVI